MTFAETTTSMGEYPPVVRIALRLPVMVSRSIETFSSSDHLLNGDVQRAAVLETGLSHAKL
ncbi:hypothetical protein NBRC116589_37660 [Ruegeria sp. HU-ET01832]